MKIFNQLFLAALVMASCWSCARQQEQGEQKTDKDEAKLVSPIGANASSPYLTQDHKGNPVLCWTEQLTDEAGFVVKLATFDPAKEAFGNIITVSPSKGTTPHPEKMNKVVFKSDGTMVAAFTKKHPTPTNRFAGSILYTQSFDLGISWTPADYLHSDTSSSVGRGYFDLATLPDGEVGAIWLDGRYGKERKGSALFFSKTVEKKGFIPDKPIGESTCECCRTDIYVDKENNLNIVYRDILQDSIRDVVHQFSMDNGETFSEARLISRDNWVIDACPHTGPSLTQNSQGLYAAWFTAAGARGIYLTHTKDNGKTFSLREKVSESARHPQLATLPDDKLLLVWDEPLAGGFSPMHEGMHQGDTHTASRGGSKIVLQIRRDNVAQKTFVLSKPGVQATYPVLSHYQDGKVLVAWSQQTQKGSGIYYRWLDLNR